MYASVRELIAELGEERSDAAEGAAAAGPSPKRSRLEEGYEAYDDVWASINVMASHRG